MQLNVARDFPAAQVGDGTNFVLVFAGALLEHAEELLRMGLSPTEVIEGYDMACQKALEILPSTFRIVVIRRERSGESP